MRFFQDSSQLFKGDDRPVTTIDSHTEGESTRLIVGGVGDIPGAGMMEKLDYFKTHYDSVRCLVTKEPRGSREVLAAMVTENTTPGAAFGLIYMDAKRYPYLCGHATIGAVVSLARTGFLCLGEGENRVLVDTPSGPMEVRARVEDKEVTAVSIDMVPSFVMETGREIQVPGFGPVTVDLVCTGGVFAMVDADRLGIDPVMENKNLLVDLGMKIIDAANDQIEVIHPVRPDVNTVDVTEFYNSGIQDGKARGRGVVVYGESHMDRSPCGTGTAAKLALLAHYGKIQMDQPYMNYSPLGTWFKAKIVETTRVGEHQAYITRIQGRAWVTGLHHFVLDKADPFDRGYLV